MQDRAVRLGVHPPGSHDRMLLTLVMPTQHIGTYPHTHMPTHAHARTHAHMPALTNTRARTHNAHMHATAWLHAGVS